MYNNRSWSDLKDIAWWDRPPRTSPVPAARPPRPARPRIYSRRTRRCRLPGIVRTGCFSPWGEAASVGHASPGMCSTGPMRGSECVSTKSRRHGAPLLRSSVSRKVRLLPLPQRRHLLHTFLQSAQKSRLERKRNYTPWLRCHTVFPYPVMRRWNSAAYTVCITRISNKKVLLLLINLIHYLIFLLFFFYCIFIFI